MFARDLHLLFTLASLIALLAVTVEAAARLLRGRPPGPFAARGRELTPDLGHPRLGS
jgi:hypothetical protein